VFRSAPRREYIPIGSTMASMPSMGLNKTPNTLPMKLLDSYKISIRSDWDLVIETNSILI
tara:strand:+ start:330 stop:509 length:180 start_codon:yes stop_codon:yes gene_type:complete